MRWVLRGTGILLATGGSLLLLWVLAVWQWQDPITLVVNKRAQSELSCAYEVRVVRERIAPTPRPRSPRRARRSSQRRTGSEPRQATRSAA